MAFNPTSAKKVTPSTGFNPRSAKQVTVDTIDAPDEQGTPWLGKDGLISKTFQAGTTSLAQSASELMGQTKAITRYPDQQYMEPEQVEADDKYRASSAMSLSGRPTISGVRPVDLSPEQKAAQAQDIASDEDIEADRLIADMLAKKADEVRAPEAKDGPWSSFKGFVANAGESGVRMAPALALGALSGGSSIVALSAIGADVAGASLHEGRQMGLSEEDNMTRAGLMVMAEVVPESLVIGKFLKAVPGQQLRNWVKASVGEGAQEMVTEMMQSIIDKGIYEEDASAKEVFEWLASTDAWKEITYAGAIGMGMGAALAAPAAVIPAKESDRGNDSGPENRTSQADIVENEDGTFTATVLTDSGESTITTESLLDAEAFVNQVTQESPAGTLPPVEDMDPVSLGIEQGQTIDQEVTDVDSIRSSESTRGQEISAQAIQQQPQDGSRGGYSQPLELVPLAEQSVRQPDAEGERWLQGVDGSVQPGEQGLSEPGSAIEYVPPELGESSLELVPKENRMGLPSGAFPDRILSRYRGEVPYEPASIGPTKTESLARNIEAEIAQFADQTAENFRQPLVEDPPDYAPTEPARYTQPPGLEDSRIQEDMYRETIKGMADRLPADLGGKDKINVQRDDLFTAVAKLGGINRAEAKREGIDPAQFTQRAGSRYIFPAEGGRPLDELQEALPESGFDVSDRNGLLDLIDQQLRGDTVYSMNNAFDQADNAWYERLSANSETKLPPQAVKRAVDKALAGEKLGAREARILSAMLNEASEGTQETAIESGAIDPDALIEEYFAASISEQDLALDLLSAMKDGYSESELQTVINDGSIESAYEELEQIRQAEPAGDTSGESVAVSDPDAQSRDNTGAVAAIEAAANEAATSPLNDRPEPTPAQKEAGNYKKGAPFTLHGLRIVIENPKGSIRKGDGWQNTMAAHYGDVKRTEGADGDGIDVFVGDNPESEQAWIIDQVDQKTGVFDEHKVMLGFESEESAVQAYQDSYDGDWTVGPVSAIPVRQLRLWMERGNTAEPFAPASAFPVNPAPVSESAPEPADESQENPAPGAGLSESEPERKAAPKPMTVPEQEGAVTEAAPDAKPGYGESNTIFTKEQADSAAEIIRKKLNDQRAGFDPELMNAVFTRVGYHVEAGARKFADVVAAMSEEFGDTVVPFLKGAYNNLRDYPGFEAASDMDSADVVDKYFANSDSVADEGAQPEKGATVAPQEKPKYEPNYDDYRALLGPGASALWKNPNDKYQSVRIENVYSDGGLRLRYMSSGALVDPVRNREYLRLDRLYPSDHIDELSAFDQTPIPAEEPAPVSEPVTDIADAPLDEEYDGQTADTLRELIEMRMDVLKTNRDLKRTIADFNGVKVGAITAEQMKEAQEIYEALLVERARDTVTQPGADDKMIFKLLLQQYKNQLNLNVRSSTSMENQAYSTPAPIAYLAARMAGIDQNASVYEPTAGNGMLLLTASTDNALVNELNDERADALQGMGFNVTRNDATTYVPDEKVDAVIANPPFGKMCHEDGRVRSVDFEGYKLREIDHLISANSMQAMKDDGRTVLIIGADDMKPGNIRANDRIFFNWLYGNHNVVDHFEIDGDLYRRQGAGWSIAVIVVDGRAETGKFSPKNDTIERLSDWDAIYERASRNLADTSGRPKRVRTDVPVRKDQPANDGPGNLDLFANQPAGTDGRSGGESRAGTGRTAGAVSDRSGTSANDSGATGSQRLPGGPVEQAGTQQQDEAGGAVVSAGTGRNDASAVRGTPAKRPIERKKDTGSGFQAFYNAKSGGFNDEVLTPRNMAEPIETALNDIEAAVGGDIDAYVVEKLGYKDKAELHDAMMGLQVDSVAAAIYNFEAKGKAIIIADQTGVGKGRQAAGILRYAMKEGKTPIFLTVKDNLFTDMYNDLADIGVKDAKPFILNNDVGIKQGNKTLFANKGVARKRMIADAIETGELPGDTNMLFFTYSQVNTENDQRKLVKALSENAVIVMDESHNAAGEREKVLKGGVKKLTGAGYIYDLIDGKDVTYLSATYAKRPDNMPIYYRTDVMDAVDSADELITAVDRGGVPLQQVMSSMLAESGQLFRRERSFDGISIPTVIDYDNGSVHSEIADQVTLGLRAITAVDSEFHVFVKEVLKDEYGDIGGDVSGAGNRASSGVDHTNFNAVVHNYIRQLLLALKADKAVEYAIEQHKKGIKPVIALENTMGSFLSQFAEDSNLNQGDIVNADYRDILLRALDRTRRISVKNPQGESRPIDVPFDKLSRNLQRKYLEAKEIIESVQIEELPLSPIDYMRQKLSEAGIRVAEITGRDLTIDYIDGEPTLGRRDPNERKDKRGTVDKFNNGELDALILNVAGSTGLSIHASEKFKDQKPRHMIVAQPMLDVNILVQMLGRINRTGQVELPGYTVMGLDLPAEKRPLAVAARKMKSLNANTSANSKSDTSLNAPDMLNKYGDKVIGEYLRENVLLARQLDIPVPNANADGDVVDAGGTALKFTGRMALLPVKDQVAIYEEIETAYAELIDFLNTTGQNDLEASTVDLQAKILDSKVAYEGKAPDTIFGQHTTLHRVDAKYQGNPPTPDDVVKAVEKGKREGMTPDSIMQSKIANEADYIAQLQKKLDDARAQLAEAEEGAAQAGDEKAKTKADEKLHNANTRVENAESDINRIATLRKVLERNLQDFTVGQRVYLDLGDEHANGVVIGLKDTSKPGVGNPYAGSKTRIKFMVASGIRQIEVNMNQLDPLNGIVLNSYNNNSEDALRSAFQHSAKDRREVRYVATGNLIAGSAQLKGRIVNFSDIGGKLYQGILLPKTYTREHYDALGANTDVTLRDVDATARMMNDYNVMIFGPNKAVTIEKVRDEFEIAVPKSNRDSVGKLIKFDERLRGMIGDFYGSGKTMTQRFPGAQLKPVLTRLQELTPLYLKPEYRAMYEASGGAKQVEAPTNFDGDERPQFSMGTRISAIDRDGKNGRQTIAQVKDAIAPVVAKWKSGPKVEVIADPRIVLADRITESEAASIAGMYWRGKVYLFSSNIASPEQALRTLAHEAVGHYGIERMLGSEFEALMMRVDKLKTSSQAVGTAWREVQQRYKGSSRRLTASQEAAEIVAVMAERGDKHPLIQRAIAAVKHWLRSVGFNMPWTDGDIRALIDRAEANLHSDHFATVDAAGEVRYSRVAEEGPTRFDVLPENWKDALMRVIVDKYHPIKRTQKAIRATGAEIPEYADTFLAQELINGRIDDRVRKFEEGRVQTLVDAMAAADVSVEALDVYLYAKHATERNERIAEINEYMPDGGSGMSNAEARAILSHARDVGEAAQLEELAQMVYQINRDRLDVLQRYGLESEETIDSWNNYAFYVPLKGGPNAPKRARTGKGFDIRGRESMQALGRRSLADSPLMNSIAQFEESIIRSEKSRVGQTLLNLARENPNPEYWEVFQPGEFEVVRRFNPSTREVEYVENHLMFNNPSMVSVKVEGQAWFIKIHDERLLAAVKNLGPDSLNRFMQVMSAINRVLASLNTSFNPEFVISNAARDIQTAIYNVIAEQDLADGKIAGKQLAKQIVKDIPKALRGTYGALKGKEQTDWQRHFNEFRASGGKIGFFGLKDLEARTVELQNMLSMAKGGGKGNLLRIKKKIGDSIEDLNASVENAARLSAYVNARRAGVSKAQAASLAKNLTVNFNRRGELGTVANAFWMFANASIQGTAIFARVLKSRKAQQIAGAMVVATFVLAELNRLLGGDDDDGRPYWEDVPDYVRERNLVIMDPLSDSGQYYSIPLPYGYNVFNVLGNVTNDLVHGGSPLKAAAEMSGAIMGSFNPIGFQSSDSAAKAVAKSVSPTVLTPVVQIGVNENFYGGPIFSPYDSLNPDSERGWNSTSDAFKSVARFLNTVTGGNPQQPGLVDVSPQSIKHLAEFVTGGAGATVNRTYSVIEKVLQNGDIEVRDVPFLRKVRGSVNSYSDNDQFRQRADELKQIGERYQALKGKAKFEFKKENRWQLNTIDKVRELESYLRRANKEVRLAEERGDTEKMKRLRERSDQYIDRFNKLYNDREKAGN